MFEIGRLTRLDLGVVGENDSREIQIDVSAWLEKWPEAAIVIDVQKPDGTYYPAATEVENEVLKWHVMASDVDVAGKGIAQIRAMDFAKRQIYKSRVVETIIKASIDEKVDEDAPDPFDTWVAHTVEVKEAAVTARDAAVQGAQEAKDAKALAETYAAEALESARKAEESKNIVDGSTAAAAEYAANAKQSADAADLSKTSAKQSADAAGAGAANAMEAANVSVASATEAQTHAQTAQEAAELAVATVGQTAPGIVADAKGGTVIVEDAANALAVAAVSQINGDGVDNITITRIGSNMVKPGNVTFEKMYISASGFVSYNAADRTFALPCEPNTTYKVVKDYPSTFRVATCPDYPVAGGAVTNYVERNRKQESEITITSGENDRYLAVQLFGSGDEYFGTEYHLPYIKAYIADEAETLTAALPVTVSIGEYNWTTGKLTANGEEYQAEEQQLELRKGINTVWSDCGETRLSYIADTKLYIDGKFAELQNAILAQGANV